MDESLLNLLAEAPSVLSIAADLVPAASASAPYTEGLAPVAGDVVISLYSEAGPGHDELQGALATAELMTGISLALESVESVEDQDWVSLTQADIAPQRYGGVTILGTHHHRRDAPAGDAIIRLDAGAAFGTGEHATTSLCLHAIRRIMRHRRLSRVLDMGCGTAVLAMAAARWQPCQVLAVDNDPVAVDVARANIARNGLATQIRSEVSAGFRSRRVAESGPYDLIVANILAAPVRRMAQAVAAHLRPGGYVVLSGFYQRDIPRILSRYRAAGLYLHRRDTSNEWAALTLRR